MTAVCPEAALDISNCGDCNANLHRDTLGYVGVRWGASVRNYLMMVHTTLQLRLTLDSVFGRLLY